jgi:hypothetical protein
LDGKAGRIKVDIASDGTASVDVRCADGEPMQTCADLTRDIVDRIKAPKLGRGRAGGKHDLR